MARNGPYTQKLVKKLKAIRAKLRPDEAFNLGEFAQLIGTSRSNFNKTHKDENFPILSVGAEGQEYEINGIDGISYIIKRAEHHLNKEKTRSSRLRELTGNSIDDHELSGFSVSDIRVINRILADNQALKIAEGEYVKGAEHKRIVADLCIIFGSKMLSVGSEIDAAGLWNQDVRDSVDEYCKTAASEVYDKCKDYLTADVEDNAENRARV